MAVSYAEAFRLDLGSILFGGSDLTAPTDYDLALFTGDPNNGGVECSGAGYARISIVNEAASWTVVGGTNSRNYRNNIDWIWSASVGAGWGTPNWICAFAAGTSTKLWAISIDNAVTLATGDPARVLAGGVTVQFLN